MRMQTKEQVERDRWETDKRERERETSERIENPPITWSGSCRRSNLLQHNHQKNNLRDTVFLLNLALRSRRKISHSRLPPSRSHSASSLLFSQNSAIAI